MRVAPLGYIYRHDTERLREIAVASSLIAHGHPTALAASAGAAYLVKLAPDGAQPHEFMRLVLEFTARISDEFDAAIYRVGHVLGWTGEEAVALALYCVLRYSDDYAACVCRAANTNGDSDSIACIAGGIMGARLGLDAIPADWIARCEKREYLEDLARRLAEGTAMNSGRL